ncbi:MAG: NnrS family protein [Defluviicoccus sp.]|nr:NnrS family protein [Defluviicoccus sp.]MDG4610308.1 NnrS family protein [Defluviicoccus sp.]
MTPPPAGQDAETPARRAPILLASGHRLFFLAAALWASAAMPLWLIAIEGGLPLTSAWHGHEMLFGFAAAALAGFLLTAVPNWTSRPPLRGLPLAGLGLVWLAGRVAMLSGVFVWVDLLFLPLLAIVVAIAIVGARNARNYPVPVMAAVLAALNGWYHAGATDRALSATTLLLAAMIALIGGRIVPLFTQNALRAAGRPAIICATPRRLRQLAVPSVLLVLATDILFAEPLVRGIAALAAAVVLFLAMARWQSWQTRHLPIVWILHVGYFWLPLGLLLVGLADLGAGIESKTALHALGANAIGIMILAVASRAALGHAGRPLVTPRLTVAAYGLVIAGGLVRVLFPFGAGLMLAGALWALGYAVFAIDYWPILTRPRNDGRPG